MMTFFPEQHSNESIWRAPEEDVQVPSGQYVENTPLVAEQQGQQNMLASSFTPAAAQNSNTEDKLMDFLGVLEQSMTPNLRQEMAEVNAALGNNGYQERRNADKSALMYDIVLN